MQKMLVTGGSGFIGTHLLARLRVVYPRAQIESVDIVPSKANQEDFVFHNIDVSSREFAEYIVESAPNTIYHLAAQTSSIISEEKPDLDIDVNLKGAVRISQALKSINRKTRLVMCSSMAVYGDAFTPTLGSGPETSPRSLYGITKLASELLLKGVVNYGHELKIARLFNVYGPGQDLDNLKQGMVSIFAAMAVRERHIEVKGVRDRTRDLIYVADVVRGLIALADDKTKQTIYDFGSGIETSVEELVEAIKKISLQRFGYEVSVSYTEGFKEDVYRSRSSQSFDGCLPIDQGLEQFLSWIKEHS